jgi:acetolactate synthase I/II/III large subunit
MTPKIQTKAKHHPESREITGAQMVLQAMNDHGVKHIFGYPGGAVLPIYDEIHQQDMIEHILVRHEQGAGHMAEGYARSTGRIGVALVTSGPGATNIVTPLQDALMDSIPMLCISGQVPTPLIGTDAFQECDTVGITRPCTKHNWLVRSVDDLAQILHEAFHIATSGRPGPVLVDIPKDVQFAKGIYTPPVKTIRTSYAPKLEGDLEQIKTAVALMMSAKRPVFYTGGGVINSGNKATKLLRELVELTNFPITSTLMGLGAYPGGTGKNWLGMLGMHGTYQANMCMHDCDVMINIGARFDDRITGRLNAFSPTSKKIHIDIDPSQINKIVHVDVPIIGDISHVLEVMIEEIKASKKQTNVEGLAAWWIQINTWRARQSLSYTCSNDVIMPQYAIERLYEKTKNLDTYITTEVGQHQMWAAQFYHFEQPNRWMTSGGLGTMGYGFPAAIGVQVAHRDSLVIDIAGDASIQMCIQEMSCAVQHDLPVKIFILNNQYMGMVRQWQQLLHGNRLSSSYTEAMPDFVMLAKAYGGHGIRCDKPQDLDAAIDEMISIKKPVIFDCRVAALENCFPMIPSGKAHNEMLLPDEASFDAVANAIDISGKGLV